MKENLKVVKQEMKDKSRPYQTYGYYLAIPIALIVLFVSSFLGMDQNSIGTIILVFTILANVGVSKLKLVSRRKYIAPVLIYVGNALGVVLVILMIIGISTGGKGLIALGFISLLVFPIEILAIIFFFITANDIKKAYPTMKQDSIDAREKYVAIKKSN
ncbi:hypothetical protein DOK67_0003078 [Enterococcus sp. DIV0212c]|uniref:hypothetical protein n=1 Tax=Enterococcus sp. DIV0212c TaxID=2230867 RepID=UPI001A9B2955|nr:hypothetical protein [Enterococcus sp. DIV0212c]MBO1353210.1 hypothetical protein [Enterococcus sp. DIV0212c]